MMYFTKLDLISGYRQIPVEESDKNKTAFSPGPRMGLYEFIVLPFGLTGGPKKYLSLILFAYRTTKHATTQLTPFQLMNGRDPIGPLKLDELTI